jgi:hypothetical protein
VDWQLQLNLRIWFLPDYDYSLILMPNLPSDSPGRSAAEAQTRSAQGFAFENPV